MPNITANDYFLIDGGKYPVARDQFKRTNVAAEPGQLSAKRVMPPFVDGEVWETPVPVTATRAG
jgi:hypothetical protein